MKHSMKIPNVIDYLFGFVVGIMFFFVLLGIVVYSSESNLNSNMKHLTSQFVNEACVSGKIDADAYLTYTRAIYKYGSYDIQLTVDKQRAYPAVNANGNKSVRIGHDKYSTEQIMDVMYPKSYKVNGVWYNPPYQDYELNAGDSITVTVVRKHSISTGLSQTFFKRSNENTIITRYNNVVGYSYGM